MIDFITSSGLITPINAPQLRSSLFHMLLPYLEKKGTKSLLKPDEEDFFFFFFSIRSEMRREWILLSLFLFSSLFEWLLFSILSNDLIKWGKGRVRVWWSAAMEAWGKERVVRVKANEEKGEWGEVRAEIRRKLGESESESRDQEREKIIKILNTHATITVHILKIIKLNFINVKLMERRES